jgi:hypothetical protein
VAPRFLKPAKNYFFKWRHVEHIVYLLPVTPITVQTHLKLSATFATVTEILKRSGKHLHCAMKSARFNNMGIKGTKQNSLIVSIFGNFFHS